MATNVKITIDGKEVETETGRPLLQASLDAGIEVPHFCYHPGLGVEGSCRLCLVEIVGMPKLATSCTVPVKEGMVVSTKSAPVVKARKGVLEFFLLNHPLDCPICDKGGECPLQNFSLDAGQGSSRMEFAKLNKEKHRVIGEHIILDKERCVLCNRCVRFSRDFTGREELQIRNRGANSEIFIPDGKSLTTGFTGNLADICPVGALLTRQYRFRARPWELKTVNSVCGECSLGCSAQIWKKGSDVLRMTPRIEPSVNEWWLCDRGRFSAPSRLEGDRVVVGSAAGDGASALTIDELLRNVTNELRRVPAGSLAVVIDSNVTNEEFHTFKKLAASAGEGRIFAPVDAGVVGLLGKIRTLSLEMDFPGDVESGSWAAVLGTRIEESHPVLALRLRRLTLQRQLRLLTAGTDDLGFADIAHRHWTVAEDESSTFLANLGDAERGAGPNEFAEWAASEKSSVFLSDRWITSKSFAALTSWLDAAASRAPRRTNVSMLLTGANARGIADQWDPAVRPLSDLEVEIQRGKVQALLWLGKAPTEGNFMEYSRGMRTFIQFVERRTEIHPRARWIFPKETFFEKSGTYTNTFGRVRILRRAKRCIEKGHGMTEVIRTILAQLGTELPALPQIYEDVAKGKDRYPPRMSEVAESKVTYAHYERATWR